MSTPATPNKVKYNLKNVYYALPTQNGWGTPTAIPGAVSISLEAKGDPYIFYADGIEYYTTEVNNGYDGDLEMALIPDTFRIAVLGETKDSNNALVEKIVTSSQKFALGFQVDGDANNTKFWFYNCTASRPKVESKTAGETVETQTETLPVKIRPMADGTVRIKTTVDCTGTIYSGWFNQVVTEGMTPPV